jgi:hypothetical protein
MPSGGARVRSGPAPDPNALHRERDSAEWSVLPAQGRPGAPPAWPLTRASNRELGIWGELWAKPQAVKWEELGQEYEVALYVRRLMVAEKKNAPATAMTALRQLADSLGLTTPGMRCNRWRIGKPVSEQLTGSVEPMEPSRSRLRVVAADAVEGA